MASTTVTDQTSHATAHSRRASRDRLTRMVNQKVIPRIILILMCMLFILPFYWMVVLGLKSNEELTWYPPSL